MRVSSLKNASKNLTVAAMALTMVFPPSVFGQNNQNNQNEPNAPSTVQMQKTSIKKPADFSRPTAHFPNPIGPYMAHDVKAPSFSNTPRLDQLIKDGKLYLSLDDAIALALENNLDLA